jgi:hypothetical protein
MQTTRRYDPTKDAKFHVSIATTEEIRRKWATPRPEWTGPKGTVQRESTPEENIAVETAEPTPSGDATIGLSPAVNFAGRSRTPGGRRHVGGACLAEVAPRLRGAASFRTVPSGSPPPRPVDRALRSGPGHRQSRRQTAAEGLCEGLRPGEAIRDPGHQRRGGCPNAHGGPARAVILCRFRGRQ